ncbi:nuclear pore complex protein Nup107-like, partial [Pollicipes pollicipes]|uniref:nuclear pore complex protein Nup107-like n=1 Tax=Pollicipes pollicipes TaxID=41117 RepID=UPI0018854AEB
MRCFETAGRLPAADGAACGAPEPADPARAGAPRRHHHCPATQQLHEHLSKERNTWRLLASLYRDRLLVQSEDVGAMLVDAVNKPLSDSRIAENLFKGDTTVRQAQIVVDWLELCAADDLVSSYMDKVEFFGNTAVAWENTLHALQAPAPPAGLTESMDPDGPVREGSKLHDLDQDDERRLLRYMFVLVRAGQMAEAQELCLKVGQPWRAAALEGWKLHHDPNFEQPSVAAQPVQGNRLRDLWKLAAWQLSEDVRHDVHERALLAALCGNLAVLLPVCVSWEDRVWAHFKVFVDSRVEAEVRANTRSLRDLHPLPPHYPADSGSLASMFADVAALEGSERQPDPVVRLYNTIQRCAILGEEATMVAEMAAFCEEHEGSEQLLRSLAHIVLFVRQCAGDDVSHEHCVTVLQAYVESLVRRRSVPLVAGYACLLPPADQVRWYAALLQTITEPAERAPAAELAPETSDDDRRCLTAVQWLLFEPSQRPDALREANAVCRRLLLARKLPAARELMRQIPDDSVATVLELWKASSNETELPPDQDNVIKEHLCVKAFLLGQDAYIDWSEQFYNQRPRQPELREGASFTETVAHEQRLKQYQSAVERWETAHTAITKTTTERLYNVLMFPDGGWMADRPQAPAAPPSAVDGTEEPARQQQMADLRRLYVPQTVAVLHKVLHSSQRLKEATQLADL